MIAFTDGSTIPSQSFSTAANQPNRYNGKELDRKNGLDWYDYSARYYAANGMWSSVDALAEKYYYATPFGFYHGNPINRIDPDGMDWEDINGNKIKDHIHIKVYIFYDPKDFSKQSKKMYKKAVAEYGEGHVAMSNAITRKEFIQDWSNMSSKEIKEVNLNYHGNNQTIMLDASNSEYITATGNGKTNKYGTPAVNVQDLPKPQGDISNAQLNLNTCKSNSTTQMPLKGTGKP